MENSQWERDYNLKLKTRKLNWLLCIKLNLTMKIKLLFYYTNLFKPDKPHVE